MAKNLLETKTKDEDIYEAKIKLAEELKGYEKVKNNEQIKALVDFLEMILDGESIEKIKKYSKLNEEQIKELMQKLGKNLV